MVEWGINRDLAKYYISRRRTDWIKYKKSVKKTKRIFFDNKIQEIVLTNKKLWDLMNWVKKWKLLVIETIKLNGYPYNKLDDLFISYFIHLNQLRDIKQQSTTDAGIYLTHLIQTGWIKGLHISMLVFNITQFFPSLNY